MYYAAASADDTCRLQPSLRTTQQFHSSRFPVSGLGEMGDAKSSWPEVVGAPSEVAKRKILSDRPDVRVLVAPVGSMVTTDFDDKRVRVFVNTRGDVAQVPSIG
ncbi:hypothetical protein ZWY2020_016037 [Hordeum vulgare]|nr:hypothetical protein ZWY2020_016037 [Hordeum vulgare]